MTIKYTSFSKKFSKNIIADRLLGILCFFFFWKKKTCFVIWNASFYMRKIRPVNWSYSVIYNNTLICDRWERRRHTVRHGDRIWLGPDQTVRYITSCPVQLQKAGGSVAEDIENLCLVQDIYRAQVSCFTFVVNLVRR